MKLPRLKVRTLLIAVAILALCFEVVGLGRRSRRYAAQAQAAATAEETNREVARNSKLFAAQCLEKAAQIEATDPAKAAELRAQADRSIRNILFFEDQARQAASSRTVFERAVSHPWEGDPPDAPRLNRTPDIGP
jgi:hypothetical protein